MSILRADSIRDRAGTGAPNFPNGISVSNGINATGVITATSFSGAVTGNVVGNVTGDVTGNADTATSATSATLATNAQGLTGSPSITISGENNTGISTLTDLRLASIADKTTLVDGNTVTLNYSAGGGNVAICTTPSGPITLNVNGIPTSSDFDNRAISFAVIVQQGTTAYACTSVNLNGVSFSSQYTVGTGTHIAYSGGTVGTGNTSGYDVFNFTGINTTGSASTTTNYKLLSNVNGDYRLWG